MDSPSNPLQQAASQVRNKSSGYNVVQSPSTSAQTDGATSDPRVLSSSTLMNTKTQGPLLEFHCFSRLPREMRDKIWELSVPGPRVVEVEGIYKRHRASIMDSNLTRNFWDHGSYKKGQVNKSRRAPAILHTCKESRMVGQVAYRLYRFEGSVSFEPLMIYLDVERDTVYVNNLYLPVNPPNPYLDYLSMYWPRRMNDFAPIKHWALQRQDHSLLRELFANVPENDLETVTLVRNEYPGDWFGLSQWLCLDVATKSAGEAAWDQSIIQDWKDFVSPRDSIQYRWMEYNVDENKFITPVLYRTDPEGNRSSEGDGDTGGDNGGGGDGMDHEGDDGGYDGGDDEGGDGSPEVSDSDDDPESLFPDSHLLVDFSAYRKKLSGAN